MFNSTDNWFYFPFVNSVSQNSLFYSQWSNFNQISLHTQYMIKTHLRKTKCYPMSSLWSISEGVPCQRQNVGSTSDFLKHIKLAFPFLFSKISNNMTYVLLGHNDSRNHYSQQTQEWNVKWVWFTETIGEVFWQRTKWGKSKGSRGVIDPSYTALMLCEFLEAQCL
jgi:hypothetical protein